VAVETDVSRAVSVLIIRYRKALEMKYKLTVAFHFRPETVGLCDVQPVEMLQDQAQCILGDYVRSRYPRQPTRFGRLLLLVPSLRAVRQATVEQLFFKETIGEIPIQRLLGDMYNMEKYT
jgi:nuclear receptor subfamily 2 group A